MEVVAKERVVTDLTAILERVTDKTSKTTVTNFMSLKRAKSVFNDFVKFLRTLLLSITKDKIPNEGFESAAVHITEFVDLFEYGAVIQSTGWYMSKIEELITALSKRVRKQEKLDSRDDAIQAITTFKQVVISLGSGERTSQMKILDECFDRINESITVLGIQNSTKKWTDLCSKMLNEARCIISLAESLDALAGLIKDYQIKPPQLFRKRRPDTAVVEAGVSKTITDYHNEQLAIIERPEIDRSQSHLSAYHRIEELRQENERLREHIATGMTDPEYVRCLKQTNLRLSMELDALQDEYERLRAEMESGDSE